MASFDDYNAKFDVIIAIPEDEVKSPNMPLKAYSEE